MLNAQCPMPNAELPFGDLSIGHFALGIDMPEGGLEPPTPRL
jgi:hypothetical protein